MVFYFVGVDGGGGLVDLLVEHILCIRHAVASIPERFSDFLVYLRGGMWQSIMCRMV